MTDKRRTAGKHFRTNRESMCAIVSGDGAMVKRIVALDAEVAELRETILIAASLLGTMSMGAEGHIRGLICSVSNRLNHVIGRPISSHGDQPCKACGNFDCACEESRRLWTDE